MAITAVLAPTTLEWPNFKEVTQLPPGEDAHIDMNFEIPNKPFRKVDGQVALAETFVIRITPIARVKKGTSKTATLLAHEQGHYSIGFLAGRAMALELQALRAATPAALTKAATDSFTLHTKTRLKAVQVRYDNDTGHGATSAQQTRWETFISTCMGNATCVKLNGLDL